MVKRLGRENVIFVMSKANRPAIEIESGESLLVETIDCYNGKVTSDPRCYDLLNSPKRNPATGPIYVKNAKPGDVLEVVIKDIKIGNHGVMALRPRIGILGDRVKKPMVKEIRFHRGKALFTKKLHFPLCPMLGVIGVAPKHEALSTRVPGAHGGNMDTREIGIGAKVCLPVQVAGGLLALGDVHASMGDGEVSGTGVETSAEVTIKVGLIKDQWLAWPYIETPNSIISIASAGKLEDAIRLAVEDMVSLIMKRCRSNFQTAYMLVGAVGDVRISQLVNELVTARVVMPK